MALWAAAVGVDVLGGLVGFHTPGLGRSASSEWDISGAHFAERCQGFVLIALGESIVVIGSTLSKLEQVTGAEVGAFVVAFIGAVALWWVYFDRSADEAGRIIARSDDPGRLGRSAHHFVHPVMVAGIIVIAAADDRLLAHPARPVDAVTAWMVLGGTALYLAGHLLFKLTVWRKVPRNRLVAIAVLGALGAAAGAGVSALTLGACAAAVVIAVAATDRVARFA